MREIVSSDKTQGWDFYGMSGSTLILKDNGEVKKRINSIHPKKLGGEKSTSLTTHTLW